MTDNEIIKALECCTKSDTNENYCDPCPYLHEKYCAAKISKDALDLINRQKAEIDRLLQKTQQPQWICVEERLPEMGERVIARIRSLVGEAYLDAHGVWIRHGHSFEKYMNGKVTHWMPLPASPKEDD